MSMQQFQTWCRKRYLPETAKTNERLMAKGASVSCFIASIDSLAQKGLLSFDEKTSLKDIVNSIRKIKAR